MILVGPFSSNSESSVKQTLVFNQCLQLLTVIYIALNYIFPYTLWVITTVYKSCIHLFYLCFTENLKTLVPPVFCSWDWFADIHFLYFHLFTYSPWKLLGGWKLLAAKLWHAVCFLWTFGSGGTEQMAGFFPFFEMCWLTWSCGWPWGRAWMQPV